MGQSLRREMYDEDARDVEAWLLELKRASHDVFRPLANQVLARLLHSTATAPADDEMVQGLRHFVALFQQPGDVPWDFGIGMQEVLMGPAYDFTECSELVNGLARATTWREVQQRVRDMPTSGLVDAVCLLFVLQHVRCPEAQTVFREERLAHGGADGAEGEGAGARQWSRMARIPLGHAAVQPGFTSTSTRSSSRTTMEIRLQKGVGALPIFLLGSTYRGEKEVLVGPHAVATRVRPAAAGPRRAFTLAPARRTAAIDWPDFLPVATARIAMGLAARALPTPPNCHTGQPTQVLQLVRVLLGVGDAAQHPLADARAACLRILRQRVRQHPRPPRDLLAQALARPTRGTVRKGAAAAQTAPTAQTAQTAKAQKRRRLAGGVLPLTVPCWDKTSLPFMLLHHLFHVVRGHQLEHGMLQVYARQRSASKEEEEEDGGSGGSGGVVDEEEAVAERHFGTSPNDAVGPIARRIMGQLAAQFEARTSYQLPWYLTHVGAALLGLDDATAERAAVAASGTFRLPLRSIVTLDGTRDDVLRHTWHVLRETTAAARAAAIKALLHRHGVSSDHHGWPLVVVLPAGVRISPTRLQRISWCAHQRVAATLVTPLDSLDFSLVEGDDSRPHMVVATWKAPDDTAAAAEAAATKAAATKAASAAEAYDASLQRRALRVLTPRIMQGAKQAFTYRWRGRVWVKPRRC